MSELNNSLKWELKKNPLFQELDDNTFEDLLASAKPKIYKTRTPVFHEGDPGGSMLIVLSGQIKISTIAAGGKEVALAFMGSGDVIGEITLLDGAPRTATATAMESTRVLELTRTAFLAALENNPATALRVIEILCQRLRATSEMVEDATLLAAAPRLARTLMRLIRTNGVADEEGVKIDLTLSQSTLGAHAGLLRESVNRQLRVWEANDIVKRRDNKIIILREDALKEISEATL